MSASSGVAACSTPTQPTSCNADKRECMKASNCSKKFGHRASQERSELSDAFAGSSGRPREGGACLIWGKAYLIDFHQLGSASGTAHEMDRAYGAAGRNEQKSSNHRRPDASCSPLSETDHSSFAILHYSC